MQATKILSRFSVMLLSAGYCFAATSVSMVNSINGIGPKDNLIKPVICIKNKAKQVTLALAPGEKITNPSFFSGDPYYVGADLRFGGCEGRHTYLGYAGWDIKGHQLVFNNYTPPVGSHIAFNSRGVSRQGNILGQIHYTPIAFNADFLTHPPENHSPWPFVGINLSGLEFSNSIDPAVIPNLSTEDAETDYSDLKDTQAFLAAGMNTVRVPVRWGYLQLQGPGKGNIDLGYYHNYVQPLLQTLTSAGVYTILDLHAYMHYSIFGQQHAGCSSEGPCPDGTPIYTSAPYQDIWSKLYALIKADDKINQDYLLLDLINEPVGAPDDRVFTVQTDLIKMLRNMGFSGYILVEGNAWSGLHSWSTHQWQATDGRSLSNAKLFSRDNFHQAGIDDLDKILINVHQYFDEDFSGTHNREDDPCLTDLSTTGEQGFNLQAFADYLAKNKLKAIVTEFGSGLNHSTCSIALEKFMDYMKQNSVKNHADHGFVGWTIWATGHGWGNYKLRVTPKSYHMSVLKRFLNMPSNFSYEKV